MVKNVTMCLYHIFWDKIGHNVKAKYLLRFLCPNLCGKETLLV